MECLKCKKETDLLQDDNLIYRWIRYNIAFNNKKGELTIINYCNSCELAILSNNYCKVILQLINTNNIKESFNDDFCIFTIAYGKDLYGEIFAVRCFDINKTSHTEMLYHIDYVDGLSNDEIYKQAIKYIDNLIFI